MAAPVRPNVLVIQADQFRWDCLGAANNSEVRTPHLDRLAADGVRYTNAFCTLPVCTPSRYSLISGLYVHQHGGWANRSTLAPGIDTFPKALRRAGYRTAAVGKMHFTPTYLDVGYDRMELAEQAGPGKWDDDYHRELSAEGLAPVVDLTDQEKGFRHYAPAEYWDTFGARRSDLPEEWHSSTWIGDRAERALDDWSDDGGNLLHVSFVKPHHPFDPPAPWDELYSPDELTPLPGWTDQVPTADLPYARATNHHDNEALTLPILRRVMAYYYATITQLDHHIGRLLDALTDRGMYANTLVTFTSDHGEYLGFHHQLGKLGRWMYDPLVRVPLLVKFPGRERRGEVNDALVSQVDVAPTIIAATGAESSAAHAQLLDPAERPGRLPGVDLAHPDAGRRCVFASGARGTLAMARTHTHKLVAARDPAADMLFDLEQDPHELDNRITDEAYVAIAADLRDALSHWLLFDAPPPTYLEEDAPQIDAPNVPPPDPARRDAARTYFEERIAAASNTSAVQIVRDDNEREGVNQ